MSARSIGKIIRPITACKTCGKPLSAVNASGYCRKHYGAANNSERTAAINRARWSDPEFRDRAVHTMRLRGMGRVAWCPLEYRVDYRRLTRVKHLAASQARAIIETQIATDARRYARTGILPQSNRTASSAAMEGK